ncbi:hypothetical protein LZ32DRAFT_609361 [Colletotrichum eremochloae]|nr:hypothetical protein LZ32DRAFT_609361 [Colletotrichum eremochloae]
MPPSLSLRFIPQTLSWEDPKPTTATAFPTQQIPSAMPVRELAPSRAPGMALIQSTVNYLEAIVPTGLRYLGLDPNLDGSVFLRFDAT